MGGQKDTCNRFYSELIYFVVCKICTNTDNVSEKATTKVFGYIAYL
jgi:hypothetical protein